MENSPYKKEDIIRKVRKLYQDDDITFKEGVIKKIDIKTKWSLGHIIQMELDTTLGVIPQPDDHTDRCGRLLQGIIKTVYGQEQVNFSIRKGENIPARFILHKERVIGLGHYTQDRFMLFENIQ